MSPLGRLGLETGGTVTVDLVATCSFRARIGGGSDLDSDMDPDPLSKSGGVVLPSLLPSPPALWKELLALPSIDLEA